MTIAIVLVGFVVSIGYAATRPLGVAKGATALGLIPAVGLAVMAVLAAWTGLTGAPTPLAGVLLLALALTGVVLAVLDRDWLWASVRSFAQQHGLATAFLVAAVLVPVISMGVAFVRVQAPLSPHDGAFHVETTDAFRRGAAAATWYPPGLAAAFGAVLQLTPWLDSAAGAFGLGLGLTLLAPIVVFGLGAAVWRNLVAAAAGALLVSLTHLFAYYPQIWSGWPQLLGILLVLGLWIVALGYIDQPGWRWAVLAGLLVGAIVLVHGTELYTSAIVLLVAAVAGLRRLAWRRLPLDVIGAAAVAAVCAAPYLSVLLHWAGGGGAYQAGFEDGSALEQGTATALELLGLFTVDALGVDLPVRVALVVLGLIWVVRSRVGLSVVTVAAMFVCLAAIATVLNGVPLVRAVFAATYPWSLPYRHLTFATIPLAMIAGGGCVVLASGWGRLQMRMRGPAGRRRVRRLGPLLVLTWLVLATWALTILLSIEAGGDVSFTSDDAAAMAWMRTNVPDSATVVNDTFADAGIWAPYKAGVRILFYRSSNDTDMAAERQLVLDNITRLDQNPEAAAAACALGAKWVYYGAANAAWQVRAFPPLEEFLASAALEQAFRQGDATVFRINLDCPEPAS